MAEVTQRSNVGKSLVWDVPLRLSLYLFALFVAS